MTTQEQEEIREQIETVRQSGKVNMCDLVGVQRVAYEMNLFQLVIFLEEHRETYVNLLMTGNFE